jgi:succinate dehydrogenase / fumarate reductase flavoprotein subunit
MIGAGGVKSYTHAEMLDLVVVDGHAKGIIVRNLQTGEITKHNADAVVLATGGYGNVYNLSTYARGSNVTAIWRAYKRGACFGNPCYTQIHPTCIPVSGDYQSKLTLMSESLRNDGRVWVPKKKEDCKKRRQDIAEDDRDYYLERMYSAFGNLAPRDIASAPRRRFATKAAALAKPASAFTSISRPPSIASAKPRCASVTATCSRCITRSRTRTPTRRRCASIPPCITRWAACGWITI